MGLLSFYPSLSLGQMPVYRDVIRGLSSQFEYGAAGRNNGRRDREYYGADETNVFALILDTVWDTRTALSRVAEGCRSILEHPGSFTSGEFLCPHDTPLPLLFRSFVGLSQGGQFLELERVVGPFSTAVREG